ncbi:MAG: 16S rRNA (uracil(1498)-N(3))-methyltransferase [Chitinophagales bacterium]|jgi:16S rRNA (uracil1498-N3)-methyltransferase|nr:16S rRNA (uracil(1498)-N(3))-methyltransferase [Chitinophagales bacterium]
MAFFQPLWSESLFELSAEDAFHAFKVLRKKPQDILTVLDGRGHIIQAKIISITPKSCTLQYMSHEFFVQKSKLTIAISPIKHVGRFEFFLEKITEIGVLQIILLHCARTEKHSVNLIRYQKIMHETMKQSKNLYLPQLIEMKFDDFLALTFDQKLFGALAMETQDIKPNHSTNSVIAIGPEGDFTDEEKQIMLLHDFRPIALGNHILRTETAGIFAAIWHQTKF